MPANPAMEGALSIPNGLPCRHIAGQGRKKPASTQGWKPILEVARRTRLFGWSHITAHGSGGSRIWLGGAGGEGGGGEGESDELHGLIDLDFGFG